MGLTLSKSKLILSMVLLCVFVANTMLPPIPIVEAQENTWTTLASMPTPRSRFGLTVVNNKIYAIGGQNATTYLSANEMYDPRTNTWTQKKSMPTPRAYFAITTHKNKIYAIGGTNDRYSNHLSTIEVYDTTTDTWETMDNNEIGSLAYLNAHTIQDKIYVIAGSVSPFPTMGNSYNNYFYTMISKYWGTKAPILHPVSSYTSVVVDEKIYVMGGRDISSRPTITNYTQIYDSVLDKWEYGVSLPPGVYSTYGALTSGVYAPKRIHVFGPSLHYAFDFDTNQWNTERVLPSYRGLFGVAVINDFIYVIGGIDQNSIEVATNEVYTPIGHTLIYNVPSPSPTPTPTISPTPTPTPTPTTTPTPTPTPSPTPEPEFPTTIVASIAVVAVIGIGILVYFKKYRK